MVNWWCMYSCKPKYKPGMATGLDDGPLPSTLVPISAWIGVLIKLKRSLIQDQVVMCVIAIVIWLTF